MVNNINLVFSMFQVRRQTELLVCIKSLQFAIGKVIIIYKSHLYLIGVRCALYSQVGRYGISRDVICANHRDYLRTIGSSPQAHLRVLAPGGAYLDNSWRL